MLLTLTAIAILTAVACLFTRAADQRTLTATIREIIVTATQDTIDAIVAQLGKVKSELIAKLTDLQAQIDAGTPAEQLDLGPLTAAAQALDDLVPDAPAPAQD